MMWINRLRWAREPRAAQLIVRPEEMVTHEFKRVPYSSLNSKQQEGHNFQKVSAVLADYGFVTIRLSSDWHGADFIAQHVDGTTFLKIQLKGRLTFDIVRC
jgi:hypothetical protein